MRLDVAVAVRARDREIPKNLAREDVGGPVEAADEGVARGLRSYGVVLVRARLDGVVLLSAYAIDARQPRRRRRGIVALGKTPSTRFKNTGDARTRRRRAPGPFVNRTPAVYNPALPLISF